MDRNRWISRSRRAAQAGVTFNEVALIVVTVAAVLVVAITASRGCGSQSVEQATMAVSRYLNVNRPGDELVGAATCQPGPVKDGYLPCTAKVRNRATGVESDIQLECRQDGSGCRAI